MANFFVTIVPNLKLKNGNHTIRIAVTHSGQTRYIPTNVVIDNESEFKNGKIIKRPDKDALNAKLKRLVFMCVALLMCVVSVFATDVASVKFPTEPDFLTGFMSFTGLVTVVVPAVVGFIASRLANPMNKWVSIWVTAVVGVVVTFFSWWMNLGFPPSDASVWVVVIDALFVALASTGIVSVVTSEWLAKLFGSKVEKK